MPEDFEACGPHGADAVIHHADFDRIIQQIDPTATLIRTWKLSGGISAQATALEIEQRDGRTRRLVLRRHSESDLRYNPRIAFHEYTLLGKLRAVGLPVPPPHHVDEAGAILPSPYIILEYIEGDLDFDPDHLADTLPQMATYLARIHALDVAALDLAFLPDLSQKFAGILRDRPAVLDESLSEGRIRGALERVWPLPRRNASALLHGDFWPGNLLWSDGQLVGIIDWEDAALGDPLADLAISRLDLLWAFGSEAMRAFTERYLSITRFDGTDLPHWDLWAALRPAGRIAEWAGDPIRERSMRDGHRAFITQAFAKLLHG